MGCSMEFTSLDLARIQFAANITFHILFPTITIGLGWVMFYLRLQHVRTGKTEWEQAHYFWTKIFALTFAMGVRGAEHRKQTAMKAGKKRTREEQKRKKRKETNNKKITRE